MSYGHVAYFMLSFVIPPLPLFPTTRRGQYLFIIDPWSALSGPFYILRWNNFRALCAQWSLLSHTPNTLPAPFLSLAVFCKGGPKPCGSIHSCTPTLLSHTVFGEQQWRLIHGRTVGTIRTMRHGVVPDMGEPPDKCLFPLKKHRFATNS